MAVPSKTIGWIHEKLTDRRATPVLEQIATHGDTLLTWAMIVKEFPGHHITPLQALLQPVWDYTGEEDVMRLHAANLTRGKMSGALSALLNLDPEDPAKATPPLYYQDNKAELVVDVPTFNEWVSGQVASLGR
ncbi:hypothetical protein D1007_24186 [Hordeum vulgare]|nr:hypothetical protein D1007_24186 [Hordeum vulgare]